MCRGSRRDAEPGGRRGRPARERDRRPEPGRLRRVQDALLPQGGGARRAAGRAARGGGGAAGGARCHDRGALAAPPPPRAARPAARPAPPPCGSELLHSTRTTGFGSPIVGASRQAASTARLGITTLSPGQASGGRGSAKLRRAAVAGAACVRTDERHVSWPPDMKCAFGAVASGLDTRREPGLGGTATPVIAACRSPRETPNCSASPRRGERAAPKRRPRRARSRARPPHASPPRARRKNEGS